MNITVNKVKKLLERDYDWKHLMAHTPPMVDDLLRDTLKVIDDILKVQKGISIKK